MMKSIPILILLLAVPVIPAALNAWLNPKTPPWNPMQLAEGEITLIGFFSTTKLTKNTKASARHRVLLFVLLVPLLRHLRQTSVVVNHSGLNFPPISVALVSKR